MKITELRNIDLKVEKSAPANGQPLYRFVVLDKDTGDVLWFGFEQNIADRLLATLSGIQVVQRMPGQ